MNFLAHFLLSHNHPEISFGNFMTDMLKPKEQRAWPEFLQDGIDIHHFIDDFTDNHPVNKEMRNLIRPYFRKYAGVALDLYYDYILFHHWDEWSQDSFVDFRKRNYQIIWDYFEYVPDRLQRQIKEMTSGDFLKTYTTIHGQQFAFRKMDQRSGFDTGFSEATHILPQVIDDLDEGFQKFFPEIFEATKEKVSGYL